MCPQERFACYKRKFWPVLCYKKDWATLLRLCYYRYLSLVTNYLAIKLSVTDNFSVLTGKTLLKTACHYLLLLVGFNTLTYQKEQSVPRDASRARREIRE